MDERHGYVDNEVWIVDEGEGVEVFVHYYSEVPVHHGYYDGEIEHGHSSAELSVYEDGYNGQINLSDLNT